MAQCPSALGELRSLNITNNRNDHDEYNLADSGIKRTITLAVIDQIPNEGTGCFEAEFCALVRTVSHVAKRP